MDPWDILVDDPEIEYDQPVQPASYESNVFMKSVTPPPPSSIPQNFPAPSSLSNYSRPGPKSLSSSSYTMKYLPPKVWAFKVRFHQNHTEKIYSNNGENFKIGQYVIVEVDQGIDLGQIIQVLNFEEIPNEKAKYIKREASPHEIKKIPAKQDKERSAKEICQKTADQNHLPMQITDTEFQFDGRKLTVYFSASTYVDFRQLVQSLFQIFGCRIWMVWYEGHSPVKDVFTHTVRNPIPSS